MFCNICQESCWSLAKHNEKKHKFQLKYTPEEVYVLVDGIKYDLHHHVVEEHGTIKDIYWNNFVKYTFVENRCVMANGVREVLFHKKKGISFLLCD